MLVAFSEVTNLYNDITLVVAGEVFCLTNLTKYCKNSFSKIIYTGHLPYHELQKWYQMADFGIVPSYYEQCGFSGIEMMMNALPVIASDAIGVRCMFRDCYNSIVAKIGNTHYPVEFQENIKKAICKAKELSKAKIAKLSSNSFSFYKQNYTLELMRKKYIKLINSIDTSFYS